MYGLPQRKLDEETDSRLGYDVPAMPGARWRPERKAQAAAPGPVVLVVEDSPDVRHLTALLLRTLGCTVETAGDGVEAVSAMTRRPFDLVVMDVEMPRMDGLAATRAIRAGRSAAAEVPIVALTGLSTPAAREACLGAGMNAVFVKPVSRPLLEAALRHATAAFVQA